MSKRSSELFLNDIIESIDAIFSYLVDVDFNEFKSDRKTYQAVIREFEIIGEAIKNIYQFLEKCYPNYPFREVIDFRNRICHGYFGIDFFVIWNAIYYDLPKLKEIIQNILNNYED